NARRPSDSPRRGVHVYGQRRIVEPRIENNHVSPLGVVRNDNGVTQAEGQGQFWSGLPRVLRKAFVHVRAKQSVSTVANLGVCVERSERGIRDRCSRTAGAAVRKEKLPILVVGASVASLHINLVVVVLAGTLEQCAEFKRVIAPDPS